MSVELFDRNKEDQRRLVLKMHRKYCQPLVLKTFKSTGPVIAEWNATGKPGRRPPFDMPSFADALNRIGFFLGSDENLFGVR